MQCLAGRQAVGFLHLLREILLWQRMHAKHFPEALQIVAAAVEVVCVAAAPVVVGEAALVIIAG